MPSVASMPKSSLSRIGIHVKQPQPDDMNEKLAPPENMISRWKKTVQIDHNLRSESELRQGPAISKSLEPPEVAEQKLFASNEAISAELRPHMPSATSIPQSPDSLIEINVLRAETDGTVVRSGEMAEHTIPAEVLRHKDSPVKKTTSLKPAENPEKGEISGQSTSSSAIQATFIPLRPSSIEPPKYSHLSIAVHEIKQKGEKAETVISEMEPGQSIVIRKQDEREADGSLDSRMAYSPIEVQDWHSSTGEVDRPQSGEKALAYQHRAVLDIVEHMHVAEIAKRGVSLEPNEREIDVQPKIQPMPISITEILLDRASSVPPPVRDAKEVSAKPTESLGNQQEQRIVQVHIGTIEMRGVAPSPLPAKPPSRLSVILGFDEYEAVRNYMS
jgi:hypothetical protein